MGSDNNGRNAVLGGLNPGATLARWLDWLIRPTLPALLGMLSTVSAFLLFVFTVSDATLYRLVSVYPLTREDAVLEPHLFRRMQRFALDEDRHRRIDLALIGGSSSRESLWTEDALAIEIERLSGRKIHILDLTTGGQRLLESWALAELAACDGADVIMLAVNIHRFMDRGPPDLRNPFILTGRLGPDVEAFMQDAGNQKKATLTHRVFERPAFVIRILSPSLRAMRKSPLAFITHDEAEVPADMRHKFMRLPKDEEGKARSIAHIERRLAQSKGSELIYYPMLERIRGTVERCGAHLIAFIPPFDPGMLDRLRHPGYSAAHTAHNDYLRSTLGAPSALPVLNEVVDYQPEDFYDWTHLMSEEAIKATTSAMARAITPMLEEMGI